MPQVLMERNVEGEVKLPGATIHVPTDRSALSVIGRNKIVDGGQYATDGWIYVNGKKVKKWFIYKENIRIWEPTLNDVAKLEARYYKVRRRRDKYIKEAWQPLFKEILKVDGAHVKPVFSNTEGYKDNWWLYKATEHGVSFDWVEKPKNPRNVDLGKAYYKTERNLERYGGYVYKFRTVLSAGIDKLLSANSPEKSGTLTRLILNGRDYWYRAGYTGSWLHWIKICWAEDEVITMEV